MIKQIIHQLSTWIKMLTKLILSCGCAPKNKGVKIPRSSHNVSREYISDYALKVLYRLSKNNYKAYLVGGAVRDILLGTKPKDFDVVTDATPKQISELFVNSRIIGRRFKLVHVFFGRHIIEVSTFRKDPVFSTPGAIKNDNSFGNIFQDAPRRDLSINGFYYDISDFSIMDFFNGMKDLHARKLKLIGDPKKRFEEDPARILRLIRFAVKLDFTIDEQLIGIIPKLSGLVRTISKARLYEECLKIVKTNKIWEILSLLKQYQVFDKLFPGLVLEAKKHKPALKLLETEELRSYEFIFYGVLLFSELRKITKGNFKVRNTAFVFDNFLLERQKLLPITKKAMAEIKDLWFTIKRIETYKSKPSRAKRLLKDPLLPLALALLEYEKPSNSQLINWWQEFINENIE